MSNIEQKDPWELLKKVLRYDSSFELKKVESYPFKISIYDPHNLWSLIESGLDVIPNEEIEFPLEYEISCYIKYIEMIKTMYFQRFNMNTVLQITK